MIVSALNETNLRLKPSERGRDGSGGQDPIVPLNLRANGGLGGVRLPVGLLKNLGYVPVIEL